LKDAFNSVIAAGYESLKVNQQVENGFRQAGLSGSGLGKQLEETGKFSEDLSLKFGVENDAIKQVSGQAAFLGGATGQMNQDITKLAVGLEKGSEGFISSTEVIKIFSKGINDPEAIAGIGKLKTKFPELATALKGIKDPAELTQKALQFLGPTFSSLEAQAKGPIGSVDNLKNSFHDSLESLGESALKGGQPIFDIFTKIATFFETKLAPALSNLGPVINLIITPFAELFDLVTSGGAGFALLVPVIVAFLPLIIGLSATFLGLMAAVKIVTGILRPLTEYFQQLFDKITGAGAGAGDFVELMKSKFGPVLSDVSAILSGVGEIIGQGLVVGFKLALDVGLALARGIGSLVSGLFGITGAAGSGESATNSFSKAIGILRDVLLGVQSVIAGVKAAFTEAGRVIDDVAKVISNVSLTNIGETIDKLLSLLGDAPSRIVKAGTDGVKDTFGRGQAQRGLEDAVQPMIDAFKGQIAKLKDASGNVDFSKAKAAADQVRKDIAAKGITLGFDETGPAIEKLQKQIGDILDEVAPPTGPKKLEVPVAVHPVSFKDDIDKALSEAAKIRDQIDIKSAKDSFTKLKAEFKARADQEIDQNKRAVDEITKKRTEAITNNKPIDEASFRKAIGATESILIEQTRLRAIEEREAIEKLAADRVKIFTDAEAKSADAQIKGLQLTERTITGLSLDALQKRGEAHLAVIRAQQQKELDAQIQALPDFQDAAKALELSFFNGTDHSKEAEARLKASLQQMLADFKLTNEQARALAASFQADVDKLTRDTLSAAEDLRIDLIPDDAVREREKRLAEVKKTLDAELEKIGANEELKAAAIARANQQKYKIEQDYLQKTNDLYAGAQSFFRSLSDRKIEDEHAKRRDELNAEKNKLDQEELDLRLSLARRQVTIEDFDKKVADISRRRGNLDAQIEDNKLTVLTRTKAAAGAAATELQDRFTKQNQRAIEDSAARISSITDDVGTKAISASEGASKALTAMKDVGVSAIGAAASEIARLALTTKANFGQIASYAASMLINIAQNAVAANIVSIYAWSIGQLGVIGGIAAATGAVAVVEGLLAYAEAKLAQNRPKFHTGGVDIRSPHGRGTEFHATLLDGETVFDPAKTREWGWLFSAIQEGTYRYPRDIVMAPQLQPHLSDHSAKIDRTLAISMTGVETRLDRIADLLGRHADKLERLDTLADRGKDHSEKLGWINDRMGELIDIADDDPEPAALRGHDIHAASRAFALRRRFKP
ncbi:MAG: hypothetical protein ABIR47_14575, partial [Candidatus Kapaibacterium sp.]